MVFSDSDKLAPYRFSLCLTDLLSHTLISTAETNETKRCDVHALVQLTVLQRLMRQPDRMNDILTHLAQYLLLNVPNDTDTIKCSLNDSKFVELIPHLYSVAEKIVTIKCDNDVCLNLLNIACWTGVRAGHVDVAFPLSKKNLEITESLCSGLKVVECKRDEDKAFRHMECLLQIGVLYMQKLDFSCSQKSLSKAIDIINNLLKNRKDYIPWYFTVACSLALSYAHSHQLDDAERTYNLIIELSKKECCNSIIILQAKNALGRICQLNGHLRRAYNIHKQVIDEAENVVEMKSAIIKYANVQCSLCLMSMGNWCGAVRHIEQVLTITRQDGPDASFEVADALLMLSKCYLQLNDVFQATRMAKECVSIRRSIYDPHNYLVAIATQNLASCYGYSGKKNEAIKLYNQCIGVLRTNLPHTKEYFCLALLEFGVYYYKSGLPRESVFWLEQSISEHRLLHCKSQDTLAMSFQYIGLNYLVAGDHETAANLFTKSLSSFVQGSIEFIKGLSLLAICLHGQTDYSENLQLWLQIRSMVMRNDAVMSESMASACFFIGSCLCGLLQLREAEAAFLESIKIYRDVAPAGHPDMATGNVQVATGLLEEGLGILEQLQPLHITSAVALTQLSLRLFKQGRFSDMLPLLLRSRDILTKLSPISEQMTMACDLLGTCYAKLNRWRDAEEVYEENLRICEIVYPLGHPMLNLAKANLQTAWQRIGLL
ncbi:uncharacterized protein LOC134187892 isoform X2 [Corticium candelabrum]|uniref:uncharacterized protein LOC134187892 isoform X2 n=1 Tax=Corticium candelabrum TaxID=121492 RepID=UPI002E26B6EC|nr:uncharacterized protein LOC134187892 isoform X2 [Corticium candelabrum]